MPTASASAHASASATAIPTAALSCGGHYCVQQHLRCLCHLKGPSTPGSSCLDWVNGPSMQASYSSVDGESPVNSTMYRISTLFGESLIRPIKHVLYRHQTLEFLNLGGPRAPGGYSGHW
ncbi:hypothetical protein N7461_006986 [Penicillium sp. DV-2018c]|nr:hypothetical protein N7461_006986 [Penicillium sp. DV-2018c]